MNSPVYAIYGQELAAVCEQGFVVLSPPHSVENMTRLWEDLQKGADLGRLLQQLTSQYEGNLNKVPDFVIGVYQGSGIQVAVRGKIGLDLYTLTDSYQLRAQNIVTWIERQESHIEGWSISKVDQADIFSKEETELLSVQSGLVKSGFLQYRKNPVSSLGHSSDPEAVQTDKLDAAGTGPSDSEILSSADPESSDIENSGFEGELDKKPENQINQTLQADFTQVFHTSTDSLSAQPEASTPNIEVNDIENPTGPTISKLKEIYQERKLSEPDISGGEDPLVHPWEETRYNPAGKAAVRNVCDDDSDSKIEPQEPESKELINEVPKEITQKKPSVKDAQSPASSPEGNDNASFQSGLGSNSEPDPELNLEISGGETLLGDHDGQTITSAQAAIIRSNLSANQDNNPQNLPPTDSENSGPQVLAALCVNGHPNPTHQAQCRQCDAPVNSESTWVPRPTLGQIRMSNGTVIPLDADIVIGRSPRSIPEPGRPQAHLVTVVSPEQQISRTHCEIRVDGWDIRVKDRNSNNGTFLLRPGQTPVRVSESDLMIVRDRDVIDLGEGVILTIEVQNGS